MLASTRYGLALLEVIRSISHHCNDIVVIEHLVKQKADCSSNSRLDAHQIDAWLRRSCFADTKPV